MSIITRYSYRIEKPVLYNNLNTQRLYGALISPNNIAKVGGYERIPEGSFLAVGQRLLPRGRLISPYNSGDSTITVANPYVFKPGDSLKLIGTPTSTPLQESTAVINATAPAFGTVVSISASGGPQVTTISPNSVAVDNIFTLFIDEAPLTYTAINTNNADVVNGLISAFLSSKSNTSSWEDIQMTATGGGNTLQISYIYSREIFVVRGSVAQGSGSTTGSMAIQVTQPVGQVTITPASGNTSLDIGSKIGTITDTPLGVITHEFYLTDYEGTDREVALAAYDQAYGQPTRPALLGWRDHAATSKIVVYASLWSVIKSDYCFLFKYGTHKIKT